MLYLNLKPPKVVYIIEIQSSREAAMCRVSAMCQARNGCWENKTELALRSWPVWWELRGGAPFLISLGLLTCACSQILQEEAGGMLTSVLSRATNLFNILFWLKINSCFWPIWINFTFSKYLPNWQTTIRWKKQLNRANDSPSLCRFLLLPPSLRCLAWVF